MLTCTMGTAVEFSITHFHTVTDDHASTMGTLGRHCMDCALKAIKCTAFPSFDDLKGFVIVVSTDITLGHLFILSYQEPTLRRLEAFARLINDGRNPLLL